LNISFSWSVEAECQSFPGFNKYLAHCHYRDRKRNFLRTQKRFGGKKPAGSIFLHKWCPIGPWRPLSESRVEPPDLPCGGRFSTTSSGPRGNLEGCRVAGACGVCKGDRGRGGTHNARFVCFTRSGAAMPAVVVEEFTRSPSRSELAQTSSDFCVNWSAPMFHSQAVIISGLVRTHRRATFAEAHGSGIEYAPQFDRYKISTLRSSTSSTKGQRFDLLAGIRFSIERDIDRRSTTYRIVGKLNVIVGQSRLYGSPGSRVSRI